MRRAQRVIALERELGVDHDRPRRVGQLDQAVGALAVGERRLEFIGRGRQDVAYQVLELDLAEGAARLLVGQDVLQADDLAGQLGEVLLGGVDDGEPRLDVADRLLGADRGLLEAVAEALGYRVEALLERLVDGRLCRGAGLGHLGEPAAQLLLRRQEKDGERREPRRQHGGDDDQPAGVHVQFLFTIALGGDISTA